LIMLRPLKIWESGADGTPKIGHDGKLIPLPSNEVRPLNAAELTASGHDKYAAQERERAEEIRLMRARAEVERDALLRAADAIAARDKK